MQAYEQAIQNGEAFEYVQDEFNSVVQALRDKYGEGVILLVTREDEQDPEKRTVEFVSHSWGGEIAGAQAREYALQHPGVTITVIAPGMGRARRRGR